VRSVRTARPPTPKSVTLSLSPRARGQRRGEGAYPLGSEWRRGPLTRICCASLAIRPLPAQRGDVNGIPFPRRVGARVLLHEPQTTKNPGPDPVGRLPAVVPAPSRSHPDYKKSGRRNADRRVILPPASTDADARPDLSHLPRAGRAGRGALACRRSTAALAAANQRHRSAPARASWDVVGAHSPDGSKDRVLLNGRYPRLPVPVQRAPRRPVITPAGRFAAVTSRRPREPHSPRPPASPGGRPVGERDS
jgi:hypothetical protein